MDNAEILQAVWDQVRNHRGETNHEIARTLGLSVEEVNEALERLERMKCLELARRVIDATDPLSVMPGTVKPDCLS